MNRHSAADQTAVATARRQIRLRVWLWFLFGVVLSLITVGLSWHSRLIAGEPAAPYSVIASGEIILVSVVLAASTVGDLILCILSPLKPTRPMRLALVAFLSFVVYGAGLYLYGSIRGNTAFYGHHEVLGVIETTISLILAIVAGASSIGLRTMEELLAEQRLRAMERVLP
jgi:hypothetical protein